MTSIVIWHLIFTLSRIGTIGGVAAHSVQFQTQEACENARDKVEHMDGVDDAICVPAR